MKQGKFEFKLSLGQASALLDSNDLYKPKQEGGPVFLGYEK